MKRSQIIDLLKKTIKAMDCISETMVQDRKTGETIGTIPKGDIEGMQTALTFVTHLLEGDYEEDNPIEFMSDMLYFHGALLLDLDEDGSDD